MKNFLAVCTILFATLFGTNAPAHLIGVDFGTPGQTTPTNWISVLGAGTTNLLGTETGGSTVVGLEVTGIIGGNPNNWSAGVNASTIPAHANSLANIGGNIYQFSGTLELKISNLEAGRNYDVWVFGLRDGGAGVKQDVSIQGGATTFHQEAASQNLVVNVNQGSSANDLSTYALAIAASAGGEITITVTADEELYGIAGVAIDVPTPTVTTQAVTAIGETTATGNGTITDLGAPNPTQHGVCWNTTGTPSIADNRTTDGPAAATGPFTSSMTGLSPGTTYYVRAYATNDVGTEYGAQVSFITSASIPTLNEWSMLLFGLLLLVSSIFILRKRRISGDSA